MSFARHRRTSYVALAVAVALGLSACSSSAQEGVKAGSSASADLSGNSAAALFQQLRKSSAEAKSVRIRGAISNGATDSKAVNVQIDIAGDRAGKNLKAIINDGTGVIEVLTAGGSTYVKADSAYWTKNGTAAIAKLAAGKYIKVPPTSATAASFPTVGKLLDQIFAKDISAASKLNTTVKKTDVAGVPAYLMTTKADKTKVYVSADGKAHLMRVEGPNPQLGALNFTEWNAVAPYSPPPADQVVTIPTR